MPGILVRTERVSRCVEWDCTECTSEGCGDHDTARPPVYWRSGGPHYKTGSPALTKAFLLITFTPWLQSDGDCARNHHKKVNCLQCLDTTVVHWGVWSGFCFVLILFFLLQYWLIATPMYKQCKPIGIFLAVKLSVLALSTSKHYFECFSWN